MARLLILAGMLVSVANPALAQSAFDPVAAVSEAELHAVAGREDLQQIATAENTSTVSNNSVTGNSMTGTINFDGSAFQNLNGLSVLSANTGNNVSINAAMNVNVSIQD